MKKILCLIDSLYEGGAQRQLIGLARLLKKKGYEVKFAWYYKDGFYLPLLKDSKVDYINIAVKRKFDKIREVRRLIKDWKPDVFISYLGGPVIISGLLKAFGGKFKLITSERITYNDQMTLSKDQKVRFYMHRFADYVVPNSNSMGRYLTFHFPKLAKKIIPITNFVDSNYFKPLEEKQPNEVVEILSVGRISPQKNILRYIEALSILKNEGFKFKAKWFGGKFSEDYFQQCQETINDLGINECFEFAEPTKEILKEYQKADIFCLPSIFEGFPNVVCEAMSCGLPIVCGNVCDNGDIVRGEIDGYLFDSEDVNSMTTGLRRVLSLSNQERFGIGESCRQRAITEFSEEAFVNKYIQLIEK